MYKRRSNFFQLFICIWSTNQMEKKSEKSMNIREILHINKNVNVFLFWLLWEDMQDVCYVDHLQHLHAITRVINFCYYIYRYTVDPSLTPET